MTSYLLTKRTYIHFGCRLNEENSDSTEPLLIISTLEFYPSASFVSTTFSPLLLIFT
ncbi:hypothetical protein BABINDRAFT_162556 [Babjeviella inositovora NRRL Y-12698]|uniref:Uncharacterized protein n=1 Tax=Babjeviella inositovora NRRL Y-12698 TaxID=984486 RepID=A0A1E3QMM6_9ASCO|nr:uncharacterized protein BABINDRAFT_162556 [Babjeviella inositovora NRRL Y-12698]ODQ78888.1 hypothetical protein BABINDRAFT_162556 [Babjeviella inositovora NRRL Y-12698]